MRFMEVLVLGGFAMAPLALCSIVMVAVIIWRCIQNRQAKCDPHGFVAHIEVEAGRHGRPVALATCRSQRTPIARICATGLAREDRRGEALLATIRDAVVRETRPLEWGLTTLGTIATISPYIGLLGTVLGVLRAFWHIGAEGKTGSAVVASGVAEALITTAAGLIVAIVAVVFYNALTAWNDRFVEELSGAAEEMARVAESVPPSPVQSVQHVGPAVMP